MDTCSLVFFRTVCSSAMFLVGNWRTNLYFYRAEIQIWIPRKTKYDFETRACNAQLKNCNLLKLHALGTLQLLHPVTFL